MIPYLTGFDFLGAVMKNALGYPVDASAYQDFRCDRLEKTASVQLLFCHPGTVAEMTSQENLKRLPFVLDCGYNFSIGETIPEMENATARFGHAVLIGTKETMAANLTKFYETLSVRTEDGKELVHRLYPEE